MKIRTSLVEGVEIARPEEGLRLPALALRYSVAVRNRASLPIAFLGVRFEMVKRDGKPAAFLHYSDTLRYPERADFVPGSDRFICIEQIVTDAVRRGLDFDSVSGNGQALANLQLVDRMLGVTASIDCVAFTDGAFDGPDVGGAWERLQAEDGVGCEAPAHTCISTSREVNQHYAPCCASRSLSPWRNLGGWRWAWWIRSWSGGCPIARSQLGPPVSGLPSSTASGSSGSAHWWGSTPSCRRLSVRGMQAAAHRTLAAGIAIAVVGSPVLMLCVTALLPVLAWMGVAAQVRELAGGFVGVLVWSLPTLMLYSAFRRYLQGMHRVAAITFALITANLVNALGNWVLIYGHWGFPALGIRGSALATVLARLYMCVVLFWAIRRADPAAFGNLRPDLPHVRAILTLSIPAALQIGFEVGVFNAATAIAGTLDP